MRPKRRTPCLYATVLLTALVGCGAKRPVLYPNDVHRDMGEPAAQEVVDYCLDRAYQADLADSRGRGAAKKGTAGAVVGAVLGGAVGAIFGSPGRGAAAGAVTGGGSGAVEGAAESGEGDPTFRAYVEACLREQGLQPIGWK